RHESHFQFDAGRYREWTAELSVWLEEEDPSPPPSGGGGGMPDPCCKESRKGIEEGRPRRDKEDTAKGEILSEIDRGDQELLAADPGTHHPPTPREEHRERVSCVLGPAANEKTESNYLMIDRKNNAVLKSLYPEHVCASVCAPPGSTGANVVHPLPGVLAPGAFERVKVELGRCGICGKRRAVYRSREARTNICERCYARLVREGNARVGVR
ncbi:MAG TPA: hypothetical protein PLD13_11295, partial [Methanoculleus sp.]|nr:hypothetical protein [Methanoculleus sp.]